MEARKRSRAKPEAEPVDPSCILRLAQEESASLGHSGVEPEHVLLVLARDEFAETSELFRNSGYTVESLRTRLRGFGILNRS